MPAVKSFMTGISDFKPIRLLALSTSFLEVIFDEMLIASLVQNMENKGIVKSVLKLQQSKVNLKSK